MKKILLFISMFILCGCNDGNLSKDLCNFDENTLIIDVRSKEEYNLNHLKNAINIEVNSLEESIADEVKDKKQEIVVYCTSGNRSKQAKRILENLGYKNVVDIGSINNC